MLILGLFIFYYHLSFFLLFLEVDASSREFQELQKQVEIINNEYKEQWLKNIEERVDFYKKSDAKHILHTFCNLRSPTGYTLVKYT